MIYKNKNILFVIFLISIILAIALLNYLVDPYNVIHKTSQPFQMSEYPRNMYSAAIKLSKDAQYDYLVIGGSATNIFYDNQLLNSSKVIYAAVNQFDLEVELMYLKLILKVHPEIKKIIFPVEYMFYYTITKQIPKTPEKTSLTIKEIVILLLNIDTTKESIKNIKKIWENTTNDITLDDNFEPGIKDELEIKQDIFSNWYRRNYRDCLYYENYDYNLYRPFVLKNYEYLRRIKNIIGNREIIFIIPAYHSIIQSTLYLDDNYSPIEKVKKVLVENYPNVEIYDFAYINKYTTIDIETPDIYLDVAHPNGAYGTFFYCALKYPEEFKNKDVFVKLTKDNIDKTLAWQRERLKDYSNKNSTYIRNFMSTKKIDNEKYFTKKQYDLPKNCQWYVENY